MTRERKHSTIHLLFYHFHLRSYLAFHFRDINSPDMVVLELVLGLLSMFVAVDATLFESLHNAPQDWYRVDSAPAYAKLHFRIAMTHVCV